MRQRGVALITAIVLVALATVLAVHIGTRAALDLRRTAGLVALDQGWHVALGAEAWAAQVLRDDADDSPESDNLTEAWAQPLPPLPVDGGEVRGAIEDMQGRFNLNNLIKGDDRLANPEAVEQFRRLLVLVGAQPRWADVMVDWLDENTQTELDGAEDGTYLSQSPPYRTANTLVTTTTEMMALPGMTRDEFERIRPYVAALPVGTTVNICTAKSPVLAAIADSSMDFSNVELLAQNRRDGCYPTMEILKQGLSSEEQDKVDESASETSDWFRVLTAVRIGTSEFTLYSLLERNGQNVRTALRATGTE